MFQEYLYIIVTNDITCFIISFISWYDVCVSQKCSTNLNADRFQRWNLSTSRSERVIMSYQQQFSKMDFSVSVYVNSHLYTAVL